MPDRAKLGRSVGLADREISLESPRDCGFGGEDGGRGGRGDGGDDEFQTKGMVTLWKRPSVGIVQSVFQTCQRNGRREGLEKVK